VDIVSFGPVRTIGLRVVGKPQDIDFHGLWEAVEQRIDEVAKPDPCEFFGFCRCAAGHPKGSMEYVAAFEATADSQVPTGMIEVDVPEAHFLRVTVPNMAGIGPAWAGVGEEIARLEGWSPYCGPDGCDCATAASFELYPPDYGPEKECHLYVPIRPRA